MIKQRIFYTRFNLFLLLISVLFTLSCQSQSSSCDLYIPLSQTDIDGHWNATMIGPGDTICIEPGERELLRIMFLQGTAEDPIVIVNASGIVEITGFYYGIRIDSCSHVKLSGKNDPNQDYGIQIHDVNGAGLSIEGLSTDIEVEGLEISKVELVGIFAKEDPDCSFTSTRDKYTMRNLSIHDNYIHETGGEGFYIGSSFYFGKELHCNGIDTIVFPHVIKGAKIYNNRVEHTGWDGIQVSSADSGCYIYNNYVAYDSDSAVFNQMSGFLLGGGSDCDCYNNRIIDGKGDGMDVFMRGGQQIFNNVIIRAGRSYFPDSAFYPYRKHGIYIGNDSVYPDSGFLVAYNTIISPKSIGLETNFSVPSQIHAVNNIIMNPGIGYFNGAQIIQDTNYLSPVFIPDQFIDAASDNYELSPISDAVNAAVPISSFDLSYDILGLSRPFMDTSDIGAYECHDSILFYANLTGYIQYDNAAETGVNDIPIRLLNQNDSLLRTTSSRFDYFNNKPGYFFFINVPDGAYKIMCESNEINGGNTATDALIVRLNVIGAYPLENLKDSVADVDHSGTITDSDAIQILQRSTEQFTSYPAGNWRFTDTTFVLNSSIAIILQGLCTGDVNASFQPGGP